MQLEKPTIVVANRYRDAWQWCVENLISTNDPNLYVVTNASNLGAPRFTALTSDTAIDLVEVSEPFGTIEAVRSAIALRFPHVTRKQVLIDE